MKYILVNILPIICVLVSGTLLYFGKDGAVWFFILAGLTAQRLPSEKK